MNLPDFEFLGAPLWLVTTLHVVTLALHFLAMNFLLAGVVMVLLASWQKRWPAAAVNRLALLCTIAMAATVTIGVAPLLFVQLVYPRQIYAASIVGGWFWLLVVAVVIVTYACLYVAAGRGEKTGSVSRPALFVALAGMLYVSLVYSSIFALAERPALIHQLYAADQSGLVWNPALADYLPRWLHMILGALTVGGFFVGLIGRDQPETYHTAKHFFAGGMALTAIVGVVYLMSLAPVLGGFMRSPAIYGLTASIVLSLGSLHFFFKKRFAAAGGMLFVSVIGMVYARHTVRLLNLAGQFDPASWRIAPQWGPVGLFVVCFVAGLAVVAYMLRLFFAGAERTPA